MIVIDGFISSFDDLKEHAQNAKFKREVNEVDGAVYPAISFDIPEHVKHEILCTVETAKGFKIKPRLIFLRANEEGEQEPYQAHNDLNMAQYTCIVYLTNVGGTSFVTHKATGCDRNDFAFIDECHKDCNNYSAWSIDEYVKAKPNRCLMFDAEMMHRGEPVEGFGKGSDARMILVLFYDKDDS